MSTLIYKISRRLKRELRCRFGKWEWDRDRVAFDQFLRSQDSGQLLAAICDWVPWDPSSLVVSEVGKKALLEKAEQAVRHEFDLLGSGLVHVGDPINWHRDLCSDYEWNASMHHSKIRWTHLPEGVDIKTPWELSRCMHFATLGMAFRVSGEKRYFDAFKAQITSWISDNPVGLGVNWVCPMDVALRAVNWINGLALFEPPLRSDSEEEFRKNVLEALWHAGHHISRHLEWAGPTGESAGNHFLSNLVGLTTIGLLFEKHRQGREWLEFARKQLEIEMARQVHPDGSNIETSTSYHRLVLEMFLWANAVLTKSGRPSPNEFGQRLSKMLGFVSDYTSPTGQSPQFGDNDSGRVVTAGLAEQGDHRYLFQDECGTGAAFDRWLLGCSRIKPNASVDGSYPEGGFYFSSAGRAWMGIRGGLIGKRGGHAHCDQLSFVLNVDGEAILVDRGTGSYTPYPDKRNELRSSQSHNVVTINGWEMNEFRRDKAGVFGMVDHTNTVVDEWHHDQSGARFRGSHSGYSRMREGIRVEREITFKAESLSVADRISGLVAGDELQWFFHAGPGVKVSVNEGYAEFRKDEIEVRVPAPRGVSFEIRKVAHSEAYGCFETCEALVATVRVSTDGTHLSFFAIQLRS